MAATVLLAAAGCGGDDEGADPETVSCIEALLGRASVNTDSFPSINVTTNEVEGVLTDLGEVTCSGRSQAADITYAIGEFQADPPEDAAVSDDFLIVEPGNAADRIADPGEVWSDEPGALDLAKRLLADGATTFELAAPDPDRGPVRLVGSGVTDSGRVQVIWQFATEVRIEVEPARPGGVLDIDPDLALATG